jgi:glycosyltransferase involved in cell wall biosynthesis
VRILLLNQTFHPDVAATAQYLSEVAVALVGLGHRVTVVTGRRAYDDPDTLFPRRETWQGVEIYRMGTIGLGKTAKWRRAADFASFLGNCCLRLLRLPRHDAVLALTSPPLISVFGAAIARIWRAKFYYWVMDFNPDEAIAAGWLRPGSFAAQALERMSRFSLRSASGIIALDRFMRDRIVAKGISPDRIAVIPPWSLDEQVRFDSAGRDAFRARHGLTDKFVIMYSGNHSPCHPLDTLLEAAKQLGTGGGGQRSEGGGRRSEVGGRRSEVRGQKACREEAQKTQKETAFVDFVPFVGKSSCFVFVGGGSEFARVQRFAAENHLDNILCLPYQPLDQLSASLSAADLHVVVMGNPFVGLIHPCKIYNILRLGTPVLYLGPAESHITDLWKHNPGSDALPRVPENTPAGPGTDNCSLITDHSAAVSPPSAFSLQPSALLFSLRHGDVPGVLNAISSRSKSHPSSFISPSSLCTLHSSLSSPSYSQKSCLPKLLDLLTQDKK